MIPVEQPFLQLGGAVWVPVRDGNPTARAIFDRHYSRHHYKDGRNQDRFVGPGERIVLLTPCARALFIWRKFISKDQQEGVNCAVFRNEGAGLASALICAAMDIAWARWPGERLYTYVNPRRVHSGNPGYCFKRAGWNTCGVTKTRRLIVLEHRGGGIVLMPNRPVLRYHGGKWMLAPWIIEHFPPHRIYTEAFGGAGSVLMRKPRARLVEVWNDLDEEIVNVFRVLREPDTAGQLAQALAFTPFARAEFELSYEGTDDVVEQARRTIVRSFQGFGSDSASGAKTGFRANGNRQTAHPARDWTNYPPAIVAFCERLAGVVVENRDALELICQHDDPLALHYCDPPYVHETRSKATVRTSKGYRHEMDEQAHRDLAACLHDLAGMVVVSGYACDLYDRELFADWHRFERSAHADGGLDRTEVVWINGACADALASSRVQMELVA